MTTRIGLVSDPHADPEALSEALQLFRREGVAHILCAGDIGGYGDRLEETVALLQEYAVQAVRGNHEEWALQRPEFPGSEASRDYFSSLPDHLTLTIEGLSLYMVHAEPQNKNGKGLKLFDQHGKVMPGVLAQWHERLEDFDYEVLILGHTHQVYDVTLGGTLVINPGSSSFNHSCAILTLPEKQLTVYALSGQAVQKTWNWSRVIGREFPEV